MGGVSIGIIRRSGAPCSDHIPRSLDWLPVAGSIAPASRLAALVLALPTAAALARCSAQPAGCPLADYVRTGRAGSPTQRVLIRHALRNSLVPVVAVLGLQIGHLIGGAFVVETVFAWPGLGRLLVQAIFDRDYPVVMGTSLVIAASFLAINLVVDLAHGRLDPRVGEGSI
jgi:ABC-type dipeptide/oligopeptide/nickel transport system permease component